MSVRTQVIVGVVGLALAFGAGWVVQGWRYGEEIATMGRDRAKDLAARNQAAADAQALARTEEQRRQAVMGEIVNDANTKIAAATADAIASAVVADRLRDELTRIRNSGPGRNSTVARAGQTASDPIGVLAIVLREIDDQAGILAEYADKSRIAGLACEAAYDGLR